ncbi:MAG: hypothetical protein JWN67_4870 [Actinomycetia bacterium]|nr:hypothetical protein [Actinomycetes bacterium]
MSDLFLSDDPPPRRSRPRWVDAFGLAAVVLGIVAIGVLGDRSSPGRAPAPTTTTSTTSAFRRGTPYRSTTTFPEPSTTTTAPGPQPLSSFGIPYPTDSIVLVSSGASVVRIDVDGATVERLRVVSGGGMVGLADGFVLPDGDGFQLLPTRGASTTPIETEGGGLQGGFFASGAHTFWSITGFDDGTTATERDTAGKLTGRRVQLPPQLYVAGVVDAGVVVGGHGSLTFVDATTGHRRSLGTGDLLAVGGRSIVRQSCELLECRVDLVDTSTGRARSFPHLRQESGYLQLGRFSPDGRWVALSFGDRTGYFHLSVVHLADGRSWTVDATTPAPFEFSPSGNALFVAEGSELCAYETSSGVKHCLDIGQTSVQMLAVAPTP